MTRTKSDSPSESFDVAYERALLLLRVRDRFAAEVRAELAKRTSEETVEAVLERLATRKIVDDARLVGALIAANSGKKAKSVVALREKCASRGASPEALLLFESAPTPELNNLLARYEASPKGRARAARFLASRGFDDEEIEAALEAYFATTPS